MKIIYVVGARPNFMKVMPILRVMKKYRPIKNVLVHTGQHYDKELSDIFFKDLHIPQPDIFLNVRSGSEVLQMATIMQRFEACLVKEKPDLVVVVGDVNSTIACALAANKLKIKVAHVEAGLRSFDATMPEETNRIVTDHVSDYLFTSCKEANQNLKREGIAANKIFYVGNVMIDSLYYAQDLIKRYGVGNFKIPKNEYAVLTLHRPSNVDDKKSLTKLAQIIQDVSKGVDIIYPVHPRGLKSIKQFKLEKYFQGHIHMIKPLGYLNFIQLITHAKFVLTDSGGVQEETSVLNIPCLTLRANTERPITLTSGTNVLVHMDKRKIFNEVNKIMRGHFKKKKVLPLWDGKTAERIAKILTCIK